MTRSRLFTVPFNARLIAAASAVYPDGLIAETYDRTRNRVRRGEVGDTLAEFVAIEITEVAQGAKSIEAAAGHCADAIDRSARELVKVAQALRALQTERKRARLAKLEADFEKAGGRGVELADEIDALRRELNGGAAKSAAFAAVSWTASDVQTLAPKLSDEAAAHWLEENEGHIQDRLTELGWDVISTLLAADKVDMSDPEDELAGD